MGQEPGTDAEILTFCSHEFGVTFPLMAKTDIRGKDQAPLYAYLTQDSHFPGRISWNFNKFLVNGDGHVIARFGSRAKPRDIIPAIEAALADMVAADNG